MVSDAMASFMTEQVEYLTVMASFQHARIYANGASEEERARVRETLCRRLAEMARPYADRAVPNEEHCGNITQLADRMSGDCRPALDHGRFRIGIAQKAFNLYLKYLWCLGRLAAPPPHCPFDRTVIEELDGCREVTWTTLDDLDVYRRLVSAAEAKAKAHPRSIAEWELELFNRRTTTA